MTEPRDGEAGQAAQSWLDTDDAQAPLAQLSAADVPADVLPAVSREWYNRPGASRHEERMRPYRIVEEAPDDDEFPQVVPISGTGRTRNALIGFGSRPRPWAPRDVEPPPPMDRDDPSPLLAPQPRLTHTQRLMIACFAIVCVGMVLGMVMVRVWDEASRAVAALPSDASAAPARKPAAPSVQAAVPAAPAPQTNADAGGAITTEIRILQPNYTVAPGDTLGIIARRHGTSVDALASINNLENRNSLSVGQKLIIP